jgi:prefoldin subunit 5
MNQEEKILALLETILREQQAVNQHLGKLDDGIQRLEQGQVKLEQTVNSLDSRVERLEHTVQDVDKRVQDLDKRVQSLERSLQGLDKRVQGLEETAATIKESVFLIERDHGEKLEILFDSYKLIHDLDIEIRRELAILRSVQDKHNMFFRWSGMDAERPVASLEESL